MSKVYIFDIETFANTFSLVARARGEKEYVEFIIHEKDTLGHASDFYLWLYEKPMLVGYNNINFDGQVIEKMWQEGMDDGREIYAFAQEIIETKDRFDLPYKQWTFSHKHLDLMSLNNFGIFGKSTSLKWLEFVTRQKSVQDMPFHHSTELEERHFEDLLKYNRQDVDITYEFYEMCQDAIEMRNVLSKRYKDDLIMNQPNSSIGEKIVLYSYCKYTGKDKNRVKKQYTKRNKIALRDVILPYVEFNNPVFQEVKKDFELFELKANKDGVMLLKGKYEKVVSFQNTHITYALGGIHGSVDPGIFRSNETHVIKTCDVTSMYPNIAISNNFYPEHLGPEFCKVYGNILKERKRYPKSTHKELNLAYKEAANSVYGKSNAKHNGFLKDPMYTLKTTINGQLVLTMLCEWLSEIGDFIMLNTDGVELMIPRDKEEDYMVICNRWEKLTGVELEHSEYDAMWVKDVNNYMAMSPDGKVKRKGMFCTYEDYIGNWSKNPSALIIQEAMQAYFIEGKDPAETIENWENIHDFLYGIKGSGGGQFEYWFFDIKNNTIVDIEKRSERAVRYYCSKNGRTIMKYYKKGKKEHGLDSVPNTKGQQVKLLMITRDNKGDIFRQVKVDGQKILESRYPDLDYDHYISEVWKWIDLIENKLYIADHEEE